MSEHYLPGWKGTILSKGNYVAFYYPIKRLRYSPCVAGELQEIHVFQSRRGPYIHKWVFRKKIIPDNNRADVIHEDEYFSSQVVATKAARKWMRTHIGKGGSVYDR